MQNALPAGRIPAVPTGSWQQCASSAADGAAAAAGGSTGGRGGSKVGLARMLLALPGRLHMHSLHST